MARNEPSPEVNGQAVKKPRKTRPKKGEQFESGAISIVAAEKPEEGEGGRVASEIKEEKVAWLLQPWIPKGTLSFVVGQPAVGKSTFVAWLVAKAKAAVVLPGFEEMVGATTIPRLKANGAKLANVRFLDDRPYRLPRDKNRIASIVEKMGAELLVIDPIDSYMEETMNENQGTDIRSFLESAAWIGEKTGCAVVGVRHPGKDKTNVCPGSRAWRAVPRSIVELVSDYNTPPRLIIRHYKDSLGQDSRPRLYRLDGERGKPRRFVLSDDVDASMSGLATSGNDPTERQDIQMAGRIMRRLMTKESEPTMEDFKNECLRNGVSDKSRRAAAHLLGMVPKPKEGGGKWHLFRRAKDWPAWTNET